MHDARPGPTLTVGAARTWKNAKSLPLRRCQSGWFIMTSYSASRCSPGSCAPPGAARIPDRLLGLCRLCAIRSAPRLMFQDA